MATIWVIWRERNNRCFYDNSLAEDLLTDKVKFLTASWASPLPSFKGTSVDVILSKWKEVAFSSPASPSSVQRWTPPPLQGFKLNFDGSAIASLGLAVLGGIIRNSLGSHVLSFSGPAGVCSANERNYWQSKLALEKLSV